MKYTRAILNNDDVGISVELGSNDEKMIEEIIDVLDVKERLHNSLPEYMFDKMKGGTTCKK